MRVMLLLMASLALFVGACSNKGGSGHAPPPVNKEWLMGKWKNVSTAQFLTAYDFNEGGTVKMTFQGMKEPIVGRYAWSGERTVEVEYPTDAEVRQAYESAAKTYKGEVQEKVKSKKLSAKAAPALVDMVAGKLPDKETLKVSITDPKYLLLVQEDKTSLHFEKAD